VVRATDPYGHRIVRVIIVKTSSLVEFMSRLHFKKVAVATLSKLISQSPVKLGYVLICSQQSVIRPYSNPN
jgi:hypothetical protein